MIDRSALVARIHEGLRRSPVVALVGPRQCGKTTLARLLLPSDAPGYFDLEDPASLARLDEPVTALGSLAGVVVIDEIHRRPELFPAIRVLVDRDAQPARFLVLGSASPELLRQSSESLAGRIEVITMAGFSAGELGAGVMDRHWRRGGFPRSYLAATEADSQVWRKQFVQTILERDLPQLGVTVPAVALLRLWTMLAHYHAQIWHAAAPARSLGVSEPTVGRYLDLLSGLFMVRQLHPWHANLKKRQVKAPKVYVRDSGILHELLGVRSERDLLAHPKCGASWEGYVIEEALKALQPDEAYFWATHNGAELDLLAIKDGRRLGLECKRVDAPRLTPSMRTALTDLELEHITVVYPGTIRYSLHDRVTVVPAAVLAHDDPWEMFPG